MTVILSEAKNLLFYKQILRRVAPQDDKLFADLKARNLDFNSAFIAGDICILTREALITSARGFFL